MFGYVKSVNVQARRENSNNEPDSMADGIVQIGAGQDLADFSIRGIMQLGEAHLNQQLSSEADIVLRLNMTEPLYPKSQVYTFQSQYENPSDILPLSDRIWYPSTFYMNTSFKSVNEARASLFQQIIQQTGSPALAMQAMQHTVITDRYYKYLPLFTNESEQTTTFADQAIQPVRFVGFITVAVLRALHLALTAIILVVPGGDCGWLETRRAMGQAWQAYAQVMTLPVESDAILRGEVGRDDTVEETLKRRGDARHVVMLADSGHGQLRFRRQYDKASTIGT